MSADPPPRVIELARAMQESLDRWLVHYTSLQRPAPLWENLPPIFQRQWIIAAEAALTHLASWPHDALDAPARPRTEDPRDTNSATLPTSGGGRSGCSPSARSTPPPAQEIPDAG